MRIYVGNIPYTATTEELYALFSPYGAVKETNIVMDREMNRPRGFAFVTMATLEGGSEAINRLHQTDFGGRTIVVSAAKERGNGGRQQWQARE